MKTRTISILKVAIFTLLMFAGNASFAQNSPAKMPNPPVPEEPAPQPEAPTTIILSEEEYLILKEKAENPICPAKASQTQNIIRKDKKGKSGVVLRLGGGVNYLYGADLPENETIEMDRVTWYLEGMLGYTLNYDRRGLGTAIGAFFNTGNFNQLTLQKLIDDGQTGLSIENAERDNRYGQVELGMIFFETIRLSTGAGLQEYVDTAGDSQRFNYYSTTAGLHFGARYFKIVVDVNFMYGRKINDTVMRPMVGIMFQL